MFARIKQCKFWNMLRLNKFLFVFTLRQGTILIATHQISLFFFILIILLICLNHVNKVLTIVNQDMEDDAERHGFYEATFGDQLTFNERDAVSTNNQRSFARGEQFTTATVTFLYTSAILSIIYLTCSLGLLHGAMKYKREFMIPWMIAAWVSIIPFMVALVMGDRYISTVDVYGLSTGYRVTSVVTALVSIYSIWAVCSLIVEITATRRTRNVPANDERGERLLLLDHAAHSSLLSAAQLNKLNNGTQTHFV